MIAQTPPPEVWARVNEIHGTNITFDEFVHADDDLPTHGIMTGEDIVNEIWDAHLAKVRPGAIVGEDDDEEIAEDDGSVVINSIPQLFSTLSQVRSYLQRYGVSTGPLDVVEQQILDTEHAFKTKQITIPEALSQHTPLRRQSSTGSTCSTGRKEPSSPHTPRHRSVVGSLSPYFNKCTPPPQKAKVARLSVDPGTSPIFNLEDLDFKEVDLDKTSQDTVDGLVQNINPDEPLPTLHLQDGLLDETDGENERWQAGTYMYNVHNNMYTGLSFTVINDTHTCIKYIMFCPLQL